MAAAAWVLSLFVLSVYTVRAGESGFKTSKYSRGGYVEWPQVNGWLKFHRVPVSWDDARLLCHFEGAVLASPLHDGFQYAMSTVLKALQVPAFIGVRAFGGFDYYFSVEGVPLDQMPVNWAAGEPDNKDNKERCIAMTSESLVGDVPCEDRYGYFCYKNHSAGLHVNEKCGTPDQDYVKDDETGSCYKYHKECMTWPRAHAVCSAEGGALVVINSHHEAKVIQRLLSDNPKAVESCDKDNLVFIGIYNWAKKNLPEYWSTMDGKTLEEAGYASWAEGEPNNVGHNENCGTVVRGDHANFNDYECEKRLPFVCELRP